MNTTTSIEMGVYTTMPESELNLVGNEELIETKFGQIKVILFGDKTNGHTIVTFHDIGMNSDMNFNNFFTFMTPTKLLKRFCVYNINAPGQEFGASKLPQSYIYPTMDGLTQIVEEVVAHFGIKSFIGLGSGAGANVLTRYALKHSNQVDALVMINPILQKAGWIEWFYQKFNLNNLKNGKMYQVTVGYFMWHFFGRHIEECNQDSLKQYKSYFYYHQKPWNLALFLETFLNRDDVPLLDPPNYLLKVPTLVIVGNNSAFVNESVYVSSHLDPKMTEWLKVSDSSGLVLEDRPAEVVQAFLLFLQGIGFCCDLDIHKIVSSLKGEMQCINNKSPQVLMMEKVDEFT
jgi:pimeloyl-ACP methyl ester carboxylesterase